MPLLLRRSPILLSLCLSIFCTPHPWGPPTWCLRNTAIYMPVMIWWTEWGQLVVLLLVLLVAASVCGNDRWAIHHEHVQYWLKLRLLVCIWVLHFWYSVWKQIRHRHCVCVHQTDTSFYHSSLHASGIICQYSLSNKMAIIVVMSVSLLSTDRDPWRVVVNFHDKVISRSCATESILSSPVCLRGFPQVEIDFV